MASTAHTARFPGKLCGRCGREFVPRSTGIVKDPTQHGPQGGAVWIHADKAECSAGARSNPRKLFPAAPGRRRLRNPVSPDNYFNQVDAGLLRVLSGSR